MEYFPIHPNYYTYFLQRYFNKVFDLDIAVAAAGRGIFGAGCGIRVGRRTAVGGAGEGV